MERDLADGVSEAVFQDTEIFRGGFPELTDRLADLLDDTDFLTDLNERLSALGEAYVEDKDLMRMHFYKPDKVAALFQQFAKPYQNFAARDGFHWNEYKKFITEDEINAYFTRGSNYSDSRLAIYSFFLNHEDKKERADFLKDHYGIGGSSHALCGADDSHEDHDGRGISLERGAYTDPLTGEMKKKQMKFFPDTYKNRIGKSYNDYIADHQMNMFEDFIGYQGSAVLDEPVREEDSFSKEPMSQESEISENKLLPYLAKQSESIEQQSGEIAERGMPT